MTGPLTTPTAGDEPTAPPPPVGRRLDILLDVDGVLYPLPELFTPYAAERLGRELALDTTDWEFYHQWGLGYDDFVDLLGRGVRERRLWWCGEPYPDVVGAVHRMQALGHRIHVVTARDVAGIEAEAYDATAHWLASFDLQVDTINLAQRKPTVITKLGLDPRNCCGIDDGPHYISDYNEAGAYGIVLDRWGSYRGGHPAAPDLVAVAEILEGWLAG